MDRWDRSAVGRDLLDWGMVAVFCSRRGRRAFATRRISLWGSEGSGSFQIDKISRSVRQIDTKLPCEAVC
ncbi:MAG: hypothetical protein Rhob2KO_40380 [Rhodopirellula baltica]